MRMMVRRIALAVASSLLALAGCELTTRVLGLAPRFTAVPFGDVVTSDDPELLWEPRRGFGSVNQDGLRGAAVERPKTRSRVVLLGDSIAYGIGLEGDETISVRLAQHLRSAGREVEVLNAGVSGYNTLQEARRLEVLLPGLQADYVLLVFCLNDFAGLDELPEGIVRKAKIEGAGVALGLAYRMAADSPVEQAIMDVSHFYRLFYRARDRRLPSVRGAEGRARARGDLSHVREGFDRIAALAELEGVGVGVAIMPILAGGKEYPRAADHDRVAELARARNFSVLDLAGPVREEILERGTELHSPGDWVHPNARGADLVASWIADWLLESPQRLAMRQE